MIAPSQPFHKRVEGKTMKRVLLVVAFLFAAIVFSAPAIRVAAQIRANAVFDATGVRFREVPLTPQRVLSALKGGATVNQRA